jgi:hypothetical protein
MLSSTLMPSNDFFMRNGLSALLIDLKPDAALRFKQLLEKHWEFERFEIASSLPEALGIVTTQGFDLCLLSNEFIGEELNAFMCDVKQGKRSSAMLLIQVREAIGATESRADLAGKRFATVITRTCSQQDRDFLALALQGLIIQREVTEKTNDSEHMAELLLRELKRVGRNLKRGREGMLFRAPLATVIKECVEFDPQVMENYVRFLDRRVSESAPTPDVVLQIPKWLFDKKFPGLANGTYEGHSLRVWDMLVRKYGVLKKREMKSTEAEGKGGSTTR